MLATVGPAYPSLIGDAVPADRRGRALGRVDAGQLVGGARRRRARGAVPSPCWTGGGPSSCSPCRRCCSPPAGATPGAARAGAGPATPPCRSRRWRGRLLRTPTVLLVLCAATAGSYYLAGASAFATVFAAARYSVSIPVADLALLALGVGAVLADPAGQPGQRRADARGAGAPTRLTWTAAGYLVTALAWLPSLLVHSLLLALPFLVLGSAALAATIPALDAVRVDVVRPGMRGRAEALRTLVRALAEGGAPLVFGLVAAAHGGDDEGLQLAFLLTLPGLVASAGLLLVARRHHDRDRAPVLALEAA